MIFVTLTTDFGHKDYSIAVIKAALLSQIPEANIIDISHQISPYNHSETAYILKNSYTAFPKGSIHIIGVESEFTPENIHLAMEFDGHFFIGADNGIFSLIKEELKSIIVRSFLSWLNLEVKRLKLALSPPTITSCVK